MLSLVFLQLQAFSVLFLYFSLIFTQTASYKSIWSFENNRWSNPVTLKPKIGFWINSNIDKNYEFLGDSYKPTLENLNGWNLLGTGAELNYQDGFVDGDIIWSFRNNNWENGNLPIKVGEGFWIKR